MCFSVFGTKIKVSFLFCAVLCFMLLCDKTGLIIPLLSASAIHEAGHLFCMWVTDTAPKEIKLIPCCVQITRKFDTKRGREIAVSLCGPLLNLAVFAALILNYSMYKRQAVLEFSLINLILCVFNLLPVKGLDGGEILYLVLEKRFSVYTAEKNVFFAGILISAAAFVSGAYLFVNGKFNISIIIMAIYLFVCTVIKN